MPTNTYQEINAQTIDQWCREGWQWGRPVTPHDFQQAQKGHWNLFLTPTKPVPRTWFPDLHGKQVLGLAAGGAQQIPILTAAGATCTVMDFSREQCQREREAARQFGYRVTIRQADMTQAFPFPDQSFDLIVFPVANCYVKSLSPIFAECARVLRPDGYLLGGFDNGINFLMEDEPDRIVNALPYDPLADKHLWQRDLDAKQGIQFSHSITDILAGQLQAGLELRDLYEDTNGQGFLHEHRIPTFIATQAVKPHLH